MWLKMMCRPPTMTMISMAAATRDGQLVVLANG